MNIITSKTRAKIKRNPSDVQKMKQELQHKIKERGLAELVPMQGQDIEKMSKDIDAAGGFFKEEMEMRRDKRRKIKMKNFLDGQKKRMKEAPEKYFSRKNKSN